MISATNLAYMRSTAESALNQTCTIKRVTLVSDNAGGHTEQEVTVGTEACRVDFLSPYSPVIREVADRVQDKEIRLISFPYNASVEESDQLTIDEEVYTVLRILKEPWPILKQAVSYKL